MEMRGFEGSCGENGQRGLTMKMGETRLFFDGLWAFLIRKGVSYIWGEECSYIVGFREEKT